MANKEKSIEELPSITDYHWERSKKAMLEVEEMLKHPLTLEQKKAQIARSESQRPILRIEVKEVDYLEGYKLNITFNDGKTQVVDFSALFSVYHDNKTVVKYKTLANFKKFKIEDSNVVWGKNRDLIFPVHELYNGKINLELPASK